MQMLLQCMYAVCFRHNSGPQLLPQPQPAQRKIGTAAAPAHALNQELQMNQQIECITKDAADRLQRKQQVENELKEERERVDAIEYQAHQHAAFQVLKVLRQKRKAEDELTTKSKMYREVAELACDRAKEAAIEADTLRAANAQLTAENSALQLDCCVCTDARPSVLYLPCKHLSVCDSCDTDIKAKKMACPICQAAIKRRHKGVHM